jgi:hypothetical protein
MATLQELATDSSMVDWKLIGKNALIKVISTEEAPDVIRRKFATGYVTQAKFLKGLNAFQIERDLGLRPQSLGKGAFILYFARLPRLSEVEQRFTAALPDGKVWTPGMHDAFDKARDAYKSSHATRVEYYPPGSARAKQWKLISPVPLSGKSIQVTPSMTFNLLE